MIGIDFFHQLPLPAKILLLLQAVLYIIAFLGTPKPEEYDSDFDPYRVLRRYAALVTFLERR